MTKYDSIPANFICPITQDIMETPVLLLEDGYSYEKNALEKWLQNHNTSPMTNQSLKTKTYAANYNLKSIIEDYRRTKTEHDFHSFRICYGRAQNSDWINSPKLTIIISLLGSSNVGKTMLVEHLRSGLLSKHLKTQVTVTPELHFLYLDYLFEDRYVITIQLYDCAGTDRFEAVSDQHFRNCHGAVLMIDSTNIESFDRLQSYWFERLREKSQFDNVETVLACNKIDLLENTSPNHCKEYFSKIDRFSSKHQIPTFNTSAIRGDNVQALFHRLITNVLNNQSLLKAIKQKSSENTMQISSSNQTVQLSKKKSSSGCC